MSRRRVPFDYMMLEKIPGRDLGYELGSMTREQMTAVAEQIAAFQRKVAELPKGAGYGWVPINDEPGPYRTWGDLVAENRKNSVANAQGSLTAEDIGRLDRKLSQLQPYFDRIEPVCFLDDVTTKNVIIRNGKLEGIIDFDCVCYGDPLYMIALTQTAVVCDVNENALFYIDELCRCFGLSERERNIVNVYSVIFAADFIGFCRKSGDAEAEKRLLASIRRWLADE